MKCIYKKYDINKTFYLNIMTYNFGHYLLSDITTFKQIK